MRNPFSTHGQVEPAARPLLALNAHKKTLTGEFFAAHSDCPDRAGPPALRDWFVLDLKKHALV